MNLNGAPQMSEETLEDACSFLVRRLRAAAEATNRAARRAAQTNMDRTAADAMFFAVDAAFSAASVASVANPVVDRTDVVARVAEAAQRAADAAKTAAFLVVETADFPDPGPTARRAAVARERVSDAGVAAIRVAEAAGAARKAAEAGDPAKAARAIRVVGYEVSSAFEMADRAIGKVSGGRRRMRAAGGAARPVGVVTRRVLAVGCALLPAGDRDRFAEEWLSLLTELPTRRARAGQVLSILRGAPCQAWTLRRPLKHVPPA